MPRRGGSDSNDATARADDDVSTVNCFVAVVVAVVTVARYLFNRRFRSAAVLRHPSRSSSQRSSQPCSSSRNVISSQIGATTTAANTPTETRASESAVASVSIFISGCSDCLIREEQMHERLLQQ